MRRTFCTLFLACAMVQMGCASSDVRPAQRPLRVAGLMLKPVKWDREANKLRLDAAIREAKRQGAELVVTPEGALEGYVVNEVIGATGSDRQELTARFNALAEPCDGPYIRHFRRLSKELDIHLVLGFLEAEGGNTYNTAVLIRPNGTIAGTYRKTHFAQGYRNGNLKGHNPPGYLRGTKYPTFELGPHSMGMMICYDRQKPVVAKRLVDNGAESIINPAFGMMGDCNREFLSARARENHVPILFVHPEQTVFSDAQGEIRMDVRPEADDSRLALVSIEIGAKTPER